MADTIFGKIARGEIEVPLLHSDELCIAFADNAPQAPVHLLVIPRQLLQDITQADGETIARVFEVAAHLGAQHCPNGFRLVTNTGQDAGQSVLHWHVHVLGGRPLQWPPG